MASRMPRPSSSQPSSASTTLRDSTSAAPPPSADPIGGPSKRAREAAGAIGRKFEAVRARPITFLSDYGYEDEFAGVCRAVIAQIAPGAPLIDLSHGIARQDVRQGAIVLANARPSCPPGVHLAVVDPGVGSGRRAVAVAAAEGRFLVGPDNGLLSRALDRLGGALDAVELSRSAFRLEPVSAHLHGRDLFCPGAAHLSLGARLEEAGQAIDPASLVTLHLPAPRIDDDQIAAHAIHVDGYGNVTLDLDASTAADGPLRPG